jgi:hypothetical protein
MQKPALDSRFSRFANSKQKLSVIKSIFELWRSQGESTTQQNQRGCQFSGAKLAH